MDTLPQISLTLPEMPRFDDGMVDMRELIRTMTESLVNEIMDVQADMMCEDQGNTRNGYRERTLVTSVGAITMRIPKVPSPTYAIGWTRPRAFFGCCLVLGRFKQQRRHGAMFVSA